GWDAHIPLLKTPCLCGARLRLDAAQLMRAWHLTLLQTAGWPSRDNPANLPVIASVIHRLPSGPPAIPKGWLRGVGSGNSVTAPPGVIRPTWLLSNSVNHDNVSAGGVNTS